MFLLEFLGSRKNYLAHVVFPLLRFLRSTAGLRVFYITAENVTRVAAELDDNQASHRAGQGHHINIAQ